MLVRRRPRSRLQHSYGPWCSRRNRSTTVDRLRAGTTSAASSAHPAASLRRPARTRRGSPAPQSARRGDDRGRLRRAARQQRQPDCVGRCAAGVEHRRRGQGAWMIGKARRTSASRRWLCSRNNTTACPCAALQFLTDGRYDPASAMFLTRGREKHLVATDHLESSLLWGSSLDDCSKSLPGTGCISINRAQSGVVFQMINYVTEHGQLGLTAVGDRRTQDDATFRRCRRNPVMTYGAVISPSARASSQSGVSSIDRYRGLRNWSSKKHCTPAPIHQI
jgi:hypothetical protein